MFDEVIVAADDDEAALDALALGKARLLAAERHAKLSGFETVQPRPAHDPLDARHEIDQRSAAARRRLAALGHLDPHAEYGGRGEELARFGASVDLFVVRPRDQDEEPALRLGQRGACPVRVLAKQVPAASDDR